MTPILLVCVFAVLQDPFCLPDCLPDAIPDPMAAESTITPQSDGNATIIVTAEVKGTSRPADDGKQCAAGNCRSQGSVAPASEADETGCTSCRYGATRPFAAGAAGERRGLFRRVFRR